jgi:hypothetical protein
MAHLKHAKELEAQEKYAEALAEYTLAKNNEEESKDFAKSFERFLKSCGVPLFLGSDDDLKLYNELIQSVTDQDAVLAKLVQIKEYITENKITEALSAKLQSRGVFNIVISFFKLFHNNEKIVNELSELGQILYQYDVDDWANIHTLMKTLKEATPYVFGKMCNILKLSTESGFKKCINNGLIDILIQAADYGLKGAEAESYQLICGFACLTPKETLMIGQSKIIDYMYSELQIASLMTIARLTFIPQATLFLEDVKKSEFVLNFLDDAELPVHAITASCIVLGRSMTKYNQEANKTIPYDKRTDVTEEEKQFATSALDKLTKVIAKHIKSEEVCANAFMVVSFAARAVPEVAIKNNLHRTASIITALHKKDPHCALNCTSFLFLLCERGYIAEIKGIPSLGSNINELISSHTTFPKVVEISSCILLAIDDPNAKRIAQASLLRIPNSELIKKYQELSKKKE